MIFKSIVLNNIRSYINTTINFPKGSLLLKGDVGSGKSTILMAIEFCLFGFRSKELTGSTLLRYGEKEGNIKLTIDIDGNEIIIKRNLKRGNKSINQASGYIIINKGKKENLTPIELKIHILNMLGYPKNILNKSKDLIYRYTVYTPQETLKNIITEYPENRLDVLRKVFNIDKYKQIKENVYLYTKILKDRSNILEGKSIGIEEKNIEIVDMLNKINDYDTEIILKIDKHKILKSELNIKQEEIIKFKDNIKLIDQYKNDIKILNFKLKTKIEEKQKDNNNIILLTNQLEDIEIDDNNNKEKIIENESIIKKENIKNIEINIKEINQKITEFKMIKNNSINLKSEINSLDKCPTCKQQVTEDYKHIIIEREDKNINIYEKDQELYLQKLEISEKELIKEKLDLKKLVEESYILNINKIKFENMKEKRNCIDILKKNQISINLEIDNINNEKLIINKNIDSFLGIEESYKKIEEEINIMNINERRLDLDINSIIKEKQGVQILIDNLKKEVKIKSEAIKDLKNIQEIIQWLEKYFINLIVIMEKYVLYSIHNKFENHMIEWFDMLVNNENIQIKLDEQFTPIITQNGHDAYIENLSGGEKSSISLSYRLALNKVIHDLIPNIKTGNIIILDEPTDGFSFNQLDNIRDIINQLNDKQLIIVSHESKIETFVDNVININKDEHISQVI